MRKLTLVVALAGLVACEDGTLTEAEAPRLPELAEAIVDGRDEGGNNFFHWQPPIATDTYRPAGEFASELYHLLSVEICEWGGDGCVGEPVARFSSNGRGAEKLSMLRRWGVFSAVWNTRRAKVDRSKLYRMIVRADGVELGFADIDIVRRLWQAWSVDRDEYVPVLNRWALPIAFTVERGALLRTLELKTDCEITAFLPFTDCGAPFIFESPLSRGVQIVSEPSGLLIDEVDEVGVGGFPHGAEVTLRIENVPSGWPFAFIWGGACEGVHWSSPECTLDLTSDQTAQVRFDYLPESELYCRPTAICWEGAITVDVPSFLPYGDGRTEFGIPITAFWPRGTEVTMTAHPGSAGGFPGWEFDRWRLAPCISNPDEFSCRIVSDRAQYEAAYRALTPSVPELVSPRSGAMAIDGALDWDDVEAWNYISYFVQIARDRDFTDLVVDSEAMTDSEFVASIPAGIYWWRVKAANGFPNLTELWDSYAESEFSAGRQVEFPDPPDE